MNCGSSSVKYALFDHEENLVLDGKRERLGQTVGDRHETHQQAIQTILSELADRDIDAVGHRVVHGGSEYSSPKLIDEDVRAAIERHIPDAPMHNPFSLAAIDTAKGVLPDIPHVAVFDTAFHARMPRRATTYAIDHEAVSYTHLTLPTNREV